MKIRISHRYCFLALFFALLMGQSRAAEIADFENDLNMRQVAVEAMVVEIGEEYTRNLGLTYTLNRRSDATGSNLKALDVHFPYTLEDVTVPTFEDSKFGRISVMPGLGVSLSGMDVGMGRFSANLRTLLVSGKAQVRARTIAVALHNTPVDIETVDEVPFQDVKYNPQTGQPTLDVSYEKVGVALRVNPEILDLKKRRLRLNISELNLSSVTGFVTLQNVNRPIFAKSTANTIAEITSGETFILGGFKIKRNVVSETGVPILRRIPILGYLFKSEKKVEEKKDILFFITPYILKPTHSPNLPHDFKHGKFLEIDNVPATHE